MLGPNGADRTTIIRLLTGQIDPSGRRRPSQVAMKYKTASSCSFTGSIALVVLFVVLGACFNLSTGLLFGSIFNTTQVARGVAGFFSFIFIMSGIFVGQQGALLGNSLVIQIARFIPGNYIAVAVINASLNARTA